ncbi:MAG: MFS transporter [Solirubrobacteraceae bacterium]
MAPLRHVSFRLLLAGELISNFGDGIFLVALPLFVLAHHGGALRLGTVLAAYGVPRTALLVLGGHASDRYRPWTVMLAANFARGVAVAAFAATAATGTASGLVLSVIAVVLGAGEGMFIPASEAIVPALVARGELQAGNALISGTTQLSQLAGPAIGGVLVALLGPAEGFAIDAATFAISALTLIGVRRDAPTTPAPSPTDPASETATLREVLAQPIVRLMLITDALINLGSTGMGRVALPALAKGPMHLHATGYGALSAAMGAGLLLGTVIAASTPSARRPFLLASLVLLPAAPLIAALPDGGELIPTATILAAAFVLIAIGNLQLITGLQRWAPPELLGRLTGVLMLASVGMMPLSTLVAGLVIHLTGLRTYFPLDAATIATAVTIQLISPTWRRFDPTNPKPITTST